ncbi:TlpA disulfide reductase family protein [Paludisphaera sp.]|uniref:TlpA family protein disulfide reductase n=1 Tax=Paludisphaera sp. TaxID=2017432 RepID=UPI00301D62BB
MKLKLAATTALAALAAFAVPARADLTVGDAAPKLEVKEFIKGEPIKALEPGSIYVVEFWATWCGPCRATIPHLSELQKKHKDVKFIGVSVWEQDQEAIAPFVKEMGDKMDYRVAVDSIPEGKEADDGAMATNWMKAAGQNGIPAAFIVNQDLKVVWIGHPAEIDEPLEKVVSGDWDLATAVAEAKKAKEEQEKLTKIQGKLQKALQSEDPKQILEVIAEVAKEVPSIEPRLAPMKFGALVQTGAEDEALATGKKLLEGEAGENPGALNFIAWAIVDPDNKAKPGAKLVAFALESAKKGDELEDGKSPFLADTLARAYFVSGDIAKAVETQQRAVDLAKGTELEDDDTLKDRLEEYKKAAAGK